MVDCQFSVFKPLKVARSNRVGVVCFFDFFLAVFSLYITILTLAFISRLVFVHPRLFNWDF